MSKYGILKQTVPACYSYVDPATGTRTDNLDKEAVAQRIIERSWNMNYYLGIVEDEQGRWCLGGDKAVQRDPEDDTVEMVGFVLFSAATKDEVLDHVIQPHLGKSIFPS